MGEDLALSHALRSRQYVSREYDVNVYLVNMTSIGFSSISHQYDGIGSQFPWGLVQIRRLLGSIDSGLVGRGTGRAEDAQGTPTQSNVSPSILVYEDTLLCFRADTGCAFRGSQRVRVGSGLLDDRAPANMAHPRQSRPDPGLDLVKILKTLAWILRSKSLKRKLFCFRPGVGCAF